jgi:hypothetical protein
MSNVSFPLLDVRFSLSYVRYQLSDMIFSFFFIPSSSFSFPLSSERLTWPNIIFPSSNVSFQGGVTIGFSCTGYQLVISTFSSLVVLMVDLGLSL